MNLFFWPKGYIFRDIFGTAYHFKDVFDTLLAGSPGEGLT